jgi:hypothetical protein
MARHRCLRRGARPAARPTLACFLSVAAAAALAAPASAATPKRPSYCSPSGDVCFGVLTTRSGIVLQIDTFARYFSRYRLCVRDPRRRATCRVLPIRKRGRIFGSVVRWRDAFPHRGAGVYRVTWSLGGNPLGPTLSFRVE